jgi:hypothetical protein
MPFSSSADKAHQSIHHYIYQRPSALATRDLVSAETNFNWHNNPCTPTNHYEQAKAAHELGSKLACTAGEERELDSPRTTQGMQAKQSAKKDDQKREVMALMLAGRKDVGRHQGYSSAGSGS